jgi:F-type H+-transporting ATPase subunit delta
MKISEKQLAEALFLASEGKDQKDLGPILNAFVAELISMRRENKLDNILDKYCQIFDEITGNLKVKLTSARDLDKSELEFLEAEIMKRSGAKKIVFEKIIDKDVLGGVVIEYDSKVLDISLKNRIKLLKEELIK